MIDINEHKHVLQALFASSFYLSYWYVAKPQMSYLKHVLCTMKHNKRYPHLYLLFAHIIYFREAIWYVIVELHKHVRQFNS